MRILLHVTNHVFYVKKPQVMHNYTTLDWSWILDCGRRHTRIDQLISGIDNAISGPGRHMRPPYPSSMVYVSTNLRVCD